MKNNGANQEKMTKGMGGILGWIGKIGMRNRSLSVMLFVFISGMMMAACGQAEKEVAIDQPLPAPDPVTITVFLQQPLDDHELNVLLVEPLRKKYPHITLNPIQKATGTSNLGQLITSGIIPDLVTEFNGVLPSFKRLDVLEDITPLMRKHNIDISRFDPNVLDAIQIASDRGELYGLPYSVQFSALYYNKDIFDKFGVDYPRDGMTWEDMIELARELSREDGGVEYRGLNYEHISRLSSSLSPDIVNGRTNRSNIDNDLWRKVFELGKRIISIPGNKPPNVESKGIDHFFQDQNTAMLTNVNLFHRVRTALESGMRVDVAQYPSYPDIPNTYGLVDAHYMMILKQSKHKDAAMRVIEVMTSDEVQLASASKLAKLSPLNNPEMKVQFASDNPLFKDLNIQSIFKSKPAPAPLFSIYYTNGRSVISAAFREYAEQDKDLNTVLREADEKLNKIIEEAEGK